MLKNYSIEPRLASKISHLWDRPQPRMPVKWPNGWQNNSVHSSGRGAEASRISSSRGRSASAIDPATAGDGRAERDAEDLGADLWAAEVQGGGPVRGGVSRANLLGWPFFMHQMLHDMWTWPGWTLRCSAPVDRGRGPGVRVLAASSGCRDSRLLHPGRRLLGCGHELNLEPGPMDFTWVSLP